MSSWWQVLAIRFADRFSKGIRGAPRDVMVAESSSRLGSAYGLIQTMDSAGAVLGPLAALWLLRSHGLRTVFWAAAVPGFLCFAVALIGIKEVRKARSQPARAVTLRDSLSFSALPTPYYFVLFAVTLLSLGNSSDMFLVLRAQSIGIAPRYAPLLGLVFNLMYTLFSWPAGHLSDRLSRRGIAAGGYLVFAAVYFVFALAPSHTAIWIAMGSYGLFYALTNPVLKALVVESVSPDIRGRALGVYAFVTSIAMLLASFMAGELWKHFGPRVPFYLSSGIAVSAAVMLMVSRMGESRVPLRELNSGTPRATHFAPFPHCAKLSGYEASRAPSRNSSWLRVGRVRVLPRVSHPRAGAHFPGRGQTACSCTDPTNVPAAGQGRWNPGNCQTRNNH